MTDNSKKLTKEQLEILKKVSEISELKKTYAELFGIKDEDLEVVYTLAFNFYQQGKYDKALVMFEFLTMSKSDCLKYWKGHAATLQMLKRYSDAILAYSFCAFINVRDPEIPFHAGQCYLSLGDLKNAELAFNGASFLGSGDKKYASLKKHADLYLKTIHEKVKSHAK